MSFLVLFFYELFLTKISLDRKNVLLCFIITPNILRPPNLWMVTGPQGYQ